MKTKIVITACVVLLGVTGLILAGSLECAGHGNSPAEHTPAATLTPLRYRGMAIQISTGTRPVEYYAPVFREVADLGANTVLLSVAGYMEHAESQVIFIDARRTPSPDEFQTLIRSARELDLQVIVMPIILLAKPRGNQWRGVIKPPDWGLWWQEYREFVGYFCDIARAGGADAMIIGSELVSTEKRTDEWRQVIALARDRFPGRPLGYSANWDHYKPVKFWDRLDFIGMTSYYTLADRKNPTVDQIVARWKPIREEILNWQRTVGKPLVFTEVGWCSQEGAATAPWNYYQNEKATPAGHQEQRRLYEAFLRVWEGTPQVGGVLWWEWSAAPGGAGDYRYTPKNKPAEQVLRQWFARHRAATSQSTSAPGVEPGADGPDRPSP